MESDPKATEAGVEHVHVPTPGDHYSAATGSAIMTVIYEMAQVHQRQGGRTRVMVTRGTRHDYPVGRCVEVEPVAPPRRWQKAVDVGLGRLGLARRFGAAAYRPHCRAVEADFAGAIFVHNNPVALPAFKKSHPRALVCLWAHNEVFNTYTTREARRVAGAADRIICVSRFIADEMTARVDRIGEKLKVVHNGVDTARFRPDPTARGTGDPVILFVGRVVPTKGPDLLLRAALKLRDGRRRFKVRIVGSSGFSAADPLTPYERELRRLAEPLGDAVEFQPFVDRGKVLAEYQAASIFCAPSIWNEPVSLTVPEALACGLPTVAARRGGIPEVGGDAVLYFVPPNVDELAAHLAMLIDDPVQRAGWSAKALERAGLLAWERQYAVLVAALRDLR